MEERYCTYLGPRHFMTLHVCLISILIVKCHAECPTIAAPVAVLHVESLTHFTSTKQDPTMRHYHESRSGVVLRGNLGANGINEAHGMVPSPPFQHEGPRLSSPFERSLTQW